MSSSTQILSPRDTNSFNFSSSRQQHDSSNTKQRLVANCSSPTPTTTGISSVSWKASSSFKRSNTNNTSNLTQSLPDIKIAGATDGLLSATSSATPLGTNKRKSLPVRLPQTPPKGSATTRTNTNGSILLGTTTTTTTTPISKRERIQAASSPSPFKSSSDRYIPNRAYLDVDICRDTIVTAEMRRSTSGGEASEEQPHTPLQSEFNSRMRGALLNVPIRFPPALETTTSTSRHQSATDANDGTPLSASLALFDPCRTVALSDMDPAYRSGEECTTTTTTPHHGRLLTFRADASPVRRESFLVSTTEDRQQQHKRRNNNSEQSQNNNTNCADPYLQDQLRVLNRLSYYGRRSSSFGGSSPADYMAIEEAGLRSVAKKIGRKIATAPTRILDAPNLVDDYYLNLVSWSSDNILAVALGQSVYLWYGDNEQIEHLLTLTGPEDYVTSVCWCNREGCSNYIAVGTNESAVQLWDASVLQKVRNLRGHTSRIGSLAWNQNWLSTGSRDSSILQHDVRAPQNVVATYIGHTQEVCGLKWSHDGNTLASGGNENFLCLWDAAISSRGRSTSSTAEPLPTTSSSIVSPRVTLTQHKAAVKALAWCPFQRGVLASGGGTADRSIKFWNTNSATLLNTIDTGSQVCSLLWSTHSKEICSSHGFSEYQLILWRYPLMTKIQEFTGHHARVLHMEPSPNGSCVVSAAADETLRFWDIFGSAPNKNRARSLSLGLNGSAITFSIR
mmetsp:Transcript_9698/g.14014  ORF Transcript_9698/g.14014 Transcript_9698/m.14014 type:complete len:733 (+) Transcript_9698:133-2331(+)|eukprot:CAMPEP_0172431274 /NCGR_PEP_ID=MMETSP1064-20121228/57934_1 /TAXON_ID=202472 /ORGANISM="Aulacoseira subarctica , Strain CCAP 1002/5" /LENGTH=732 /DNA_ID=CAMNT_0013177881 /DNA_START=48 /DNA_END=2246 /DNA_ORIENTATION=+